VAGPAATASKGLGRLACHDHTGRSEKNRLDKTDASGDGELASIFGREIKGLDEFKEEVKAERLAATPQPVPYPACIYIAKQLRGAASGHRKPWPTPCHIAIKK
jgi:hypothetical protein